MVSFFSVGQANSPNGRIRYFTQEDADKMAQVLRCVRGRMMGLSWQAIADREHTQKSTLMDRCKTYLGDMGTKYIFTENGLSDDYADCWKESNPEKVNLVYTDSQKIKTVTHEEAKDIENDQFEAFVRWLWTDSTGYSWEQGLNMGEKEFLKTLKDKDPEWKKEQNGFYVSSILVIRREDLNEKGRSIVDPSF